MVELIKEQVFHRNYITSSMSGKEDEDAHSLHSNRSHGIGSLRRSGTLDSNCSSYLQQWPLDGDTIMQELVEVKKQLTEEQKHRHLELEKSFQKVDLLAHSFIYCRRFSLPSYVPGDYNQIKEVACFWKQARCLEKRCNVFVIFRNKVCKSSLIRLDEGLIR